MKITIICVGKIKEKYFTMAIDEYSKRLSKYCKLEILELAVEKTPDGAPPSIEEQIKDKEGNRILAALKGDEYVISLAIEGKKMDSVKFANTLENICVGGKSHIAFVIGGSLGLSQKVLKESDLLLSFSDMTFPHQLMRVVLLEQVYRCFRISNNEPYHK